MYVQRTSCLPVDMNVHQIYSISNYLTISGLLNDHSCIQLILYIIVCNKASDNYFLLCVTRKLVVNDILAINDVYKAVKYSIK